MKPITFCLEYQGCLININSLKNPMQKPHLPPDIPQSALRQHRCTECQDNEAILLKYKKLVDLLYKKIKQLQKKSHLHSHEEHTLPQAELCVQQTLDITLSQKIKINLPTNIPTSAKEPSDSPQATTRESFRPNRRSLQAQASDMQKLQKVAIVINGLTEQVLQLKSNFMHLRHCVYAFVKELNIGDTLRANPTLLNITLALISMFEFSENEKEEMFDHKKVKHRRREKNRNKENIFVTIKEI